MHSRIGSVSKTKFYAAGNPMNTLAHPPDSHCKCRPLENALNAFVNIQYLDGTDVRRRRRRWLRLPFSGVYGGFNGITGLHRGWCCWWWWLESRAVFWCLLWTLKLNCYLHSWNAWNAFITENTRTDTPLAVCCFLLLFSVDGWFMFRGCVRVCFLSATRLTSDGYGYRQRYLDTQNATKCSKTEDRRPRGRGRKEPNCGVQLPKRTRAQQINLICILKIQEPGCISCILGIIASRTGFGGWF